MSDIAIGRGSGAAQTFRPLTVALLLAIGIVGFVGMLVLSAMAPDVRSSRNGGAHALSNAATGYSGIVQLARATGRNPRIVRDEGLLDTEDLVVLTPERASPVPQAVLERRTGKPTLIVLPKWNTVADPKQRGWVRIAGLVDPFLSRAVLNASTRLTVSRHRSGGRPLIAPDWAPEPMPLAAPRPLQTIAGPTIEPIITDDKGRTVLGQLDDGSPTYVLADPDLLSNAGIADARQARAALALLDFLNSNEAEGIAFDVTLNGLGRSPNPLRLAFEPPFLAMTLALAAALLLAGWQACVRFGAPRLRQRAIAFGKAALIDNTAALLRKAGRLAAVGGRYAEARRAHAADAFGVPARLHDAEVEAHLDRFPGRRSFSELARAARAADTPQDMLAAAQRLHDWQQETNR